MNTPTVPAHIVRANIVKLLTEGELASVSGPGATDLASGDEYVDLERPDRGVRRAVGPKTRVTHVLRRSAVAQDTWSKILTQLDGNHVESVQADTGH